MNASVLELFPVNGLDRSLHAPVFVGLLLLAFFAETLGWTFAGLVVPGYFASVMVAAPATAVLVAVEAVLTYGISVLLGTGFPRAGLWSSAFGRERFFLFIVVGLAVRLGVEASLLPFLETKLDLPHSRELHSLGLVLVPLLANMFCNTGFLRALPRIALVVGLTYLFVDQVLLQYTNFTISRFEVANESVSLSFLEAPHAQFILLIGALLAARANVLYGWDYNGILVPALLSVAWYQPTKLLTTVVESLVVYGLSRGLAALPPLSHVLIVGTRRTILTFAVGFFLKWGLGFGMLHVDPTVHMVDFLGFGYLLPTLLAVKMWNRNAIGTVLMPTLQVSIVAFVTGNLAGYALTHFEGSAPSALAEVALPTTSHPLAYELMLGQTAPSPALKSTALAARSQLVRQAVDRLLEGRSFDRALLEKASQLDVRFVKVGAGQAEYLAVRPITRDPDAEHAAPRLAVRTTPQEAAPLMVLAVSDRPGSPTLAAAAELAAQLNARAIFLHASTGRLAEYDEATARALAKQLEVTQVVRVVEGPEAVLTAVGELPASLGVDVIERVLQAPVVLEWSSYRPGQSPLDNAATLRLPTPLAERLGSQALQAPEILQWETGVGSALSQQLEALTDVRPYAFAAPQVEELRLFRAHVAVAFEALGPGDEPTAWQRAVAGRLRYRFVRIGVAGGPVEAWGLVEPPGPERRGNATWIRRTRPRGAPDRAELLVEAPAIRWEVGTFRASVMLFNGLSARGLLIAGALPNADQEGRSDVRSAAGLRSFYHTIHQTWLDLHNHALAIHGIAQERDVGRDVVLSLGRELSDAGSLPAWAQRVATFFAGSGFPPALVDGSLALSVFEGGHDPALGYATRFAPDRMLMVWLSRDLRGRMVHLQEDTDARRRLIALGATPTSGDVHARATAVLDCLREGSVSPGCVPVDAACEDEKVASLLETYTETLNPHTLQHALSLASRCHLELVVDRDTDLLWALVGARDRGWLVPLRGGPVVRAPGVCSSPADLRRLLASGLASTRLEPGS